MEIIIKETGKIESLDVFIQGFDLVSYIIIRTNDDRSIPVLSRSDKIYYILSQFDWEDMKTFCEEKEDLFHRKNYISLNFSNDGKPDINSFLHSTNILSCPFLEMRRLDRVYGIGYGTSTN